MFTLVDPRDGAWYAALRVGHFGAKLRITAVCFAAPIVVMTSLGTTTGTAWVTQDGGGQWRALEASLPPIAALAWAD